MAGGTQDRPLKVWGRVTFEQLDSLGAGVAAIAEAMPRVQKQVELGKSYDKTKNDYTRMRRREAGTRGWSAPTKTTKG